MKKDENNKKEEEFLKQLYDEQKRLHPEIYNTPDDEEINKD